MPEISLEFIEEAKTILAIKELTIEEKLTIIIYINLIRGQNNGD